MPSERTIRLIITPALFACWVLFGAWLDSSHDKLIEPFRTEGGGNAFAIIAGGSLLLAVAGYVMSLLTVIAFHVFRWCRFDLELRIDDETVTHMRDKLGLDDKVPVCENRLPIVVAYQGKFCPDRVLQWAERRWMSVGICANGIMAVASALAFGHFYFGYAIGYIWAAASAALIGIFSLQLLVARYQLGKLHWVAARWGIRNDGSA